MSRLWTLLGIAFLSLLCSSIFAEPNILLAPPMKADSSTTFWFMPMDRPPVLDPDFFKTGKKPKTNYSQGLMGPRYWDEPAKFSVNQRKQWIRLCRDLHPKKMKDFRLCFEQQKQRFESQ